MAILAMQITESARARIAEILSSREPGSVVALMLGSSETYGPDGVLKERKPYHWHFQVYPKHQAQALERDYLARGVPLLYNFDGVTLYIPQAEFLHQLKAGKVDFQAGTVVVE